MADLAYHPIILDAGNIINVATPKRLLIVGSEVPDQVVLAGEARIVASSPTMLPMGVYQFATPDGLCIFLVATGAPHGGQADANWDAPEGHPLINAWGWFESIWQAADQITLPKFAPGDVVVTTQGGQEGQVGRREFRTGGWSYNVRIDRRTSWFFEPALAVPHIDDDPYEWIERNVSTADRFAATLTRAKLSTQLTDTVYSFKATRTIFMPYQFRPVMRLLSTGSLRLLIADEVGLGKTIEAGLIWTELDARRQADRVLVVCPSMLVAKWRGEMVERFAFDPVILDPSGLADLLERVETDRLPKRYHAICSIERLRSWRGLERLADLQPKFDLVIVDEAHVLRNSGTRSHELGCLLKEWADALIFLSATPLNLGNTDLYNLLELLAPGEFDDVNTLEALLEPNTALNRISASLFDRDVTQEMRRIWLASIAAMKFGPAVVSRAEYREIDDMLRQAEFSARDVTKLKRLIAQLHSLSAVVTRTRKVEVEEHKAVRRAERVDVAWTDVEAEFYVAFEQWQRERALRTGRPMGFVTQMPLRLASSCLPAARDRVLRHAWETDDIEDDPDMDVDVDVDELDRPSQDVVDAAKRLGSIDTKFDALVETLGPIIAQGRRVLLFTFSRAALAYLVGRLKDKFRIAELHGGIVQPDRHEIMQQFRDHEFDLLLATRVASEGLDFEFCSALVNWDLPWNPMEVEQRIGRLDRFGQQEEKILIINFHTPGTIESDIIERVLNRIGVFEGSIGELEPIIQSRLSDLRNTMDDFSLSDAERTRRLDERLSAIEELSLTKDEVEVASSYLASTDATDIEGFEREVLQSGRYVGQQELQLLLREWAGETDGARCTTSADGLHLILTGNERMAQHMERVQAAGERSAVEIDRLERSLRNGHQVFVCLDQEVARKTCADLLNANHPLVRAAMHDPGYEQSRIAHLRCAVPSVANGNYLVLLSVARWAGVRPATELWAATVALTTGEPSDESVGEALLSAVAEGVLTAEQSTNSLDLRVALRVAEGISLTRQREEEKKRVDLNNSMVQARNISLRETHSRKVDQIRRRIATNRQNGKARGVTLGESQLAKQDSDLAKEIAKIESRSVGSMSVEHIAVCVVTVA